MLPHHTKPERATDNGVPSMANKRQPNERDGNDGQKSGAGSRKLKLGIAAVAIGGALVLLPACSTLDRAYDQQVTVEQQPVVHVYTNTVVVTNYVPTIIERTNVVFATNALSGVVTGQATVEPIATNFVPVFETNVISVPVTNRVAKPAAESFIQGAATITNTFVPGLGGLTALALGGLYLREPMMVEYARFWNQPLLAITIGSSFTFCREQRRKTKN